MFSEIKLTTLVLILLSIFGCTPSETKEVESKGHDDATETIPVPTSTGKGTPESPYTVDQVLKGNVRMSDVYILGYAVGSMPGSGKFDFNMTNPNYNNIVLSTSPDNHTDLLPVELSKTVEKEGLALQYDAARPGSAVCIHAGVLSTYYSRLSIRQVKSWRWFIDKAPDVNFKENPLPSPSEEEAENEKEKPESNPVDPYEGLYNDIEVNDITYHFPMLSGESYGIITYEEEPYSWVVAVRQPHVNMHTGEFQQVPYFPAFAKEKFSNGDLAWLIGYVTEYNAETHRLRLKDTPESELSGVSVQSKDLDFNEWLDKTMSADRIGTLIRLYVEFKASTTITTVKSADWLIYKK